MKVELFPFQKEALGRLRHSTIEALANYQHSHVPQIVSYSAPTGAGKTIVMSALIENILFGDDLYPDQPDAIFVWLSDSPELNQQSKDKIDLKADRISLGQCKTITDETFDEEVLEDGTIYFLNTQKLGKSSNLTKQGDNRTYTIWDTLNNTVKEKSDRLYFIIDEAHRGMQGNDAKRATTIMQKFLKGSPEDGLTAMPIVIGMTATPERFNVLAAGINSTTYHVITTAEEVRSSGLLKDRIVITYPDAINNDMAVLQAAADDWKQKWDHWTQYCYEQHYAYINPVFVVQVENGNDKEISKTDLSDCLQKIEERIGISFQSGEVIHTFGQTDSTIVVNGIEVKYCEPSRISDDKNIRLVFFKENLSTGWDCPRAETMMSFRHANDSTYIAQLLGRMVRTPMQMHIEVDDVLNDVHLFLPYFNEDTVKEVVNDLQSSEGGNIPTDIYSEEYGKQKFDTLTVRPSKVMISNNHIASVQVGSQNKPSDYGNVDSSNVTFPQLHLKDDSNYTDDCINRENNIYSNDNEIINNKSNKIINNYINREEVIKAVNDSGLLTYEVRNLRMSSYLDSVFALAHLFSQSCIYTEAFDEVADGIVKMIHEYIESLKNDRKYESMSEKVLQFKLNTQIFDVFGESIDQNTVHDLITATDTDLDRQFRFAEVKLANEGIGNRYGRKYQIKNDPSSYKIDVILFVANEECMNGLNRYAEEEYHNMNDKYRRFTNKLEPNFKNKYNHIVRNGDPVSSHIFTLPETIEVEHNSNGRIYTNHLFADENGEARIYLNNWEEEVIKEEASKVDFVCWLRNPPRKPWSLCIPYTQDGEVKSAYPDFIIIRKDKNGYIVDVLEPHDSTRTDNLGKAKGFADYARENASIGRIQLIRMSKDITGNDSLKRLDMSQGIVREAVKKAISDEELNHIFDEYGFFEKHNKEKL